MSTPGDSRGRSSGRSSHSAPAHGLMDRLFAEADERRKGPGPAIHVVEVEVLLGPGHQLRGCGPPPAAGRLRLPWVVPRLRVDHRRRDLPDPRRATAGEWAVERQTGSRSTTTTGTPITRPGWSIPSRTAWARYTPELGDDRSTSERSGSDLGGVRLHQSNACSTPRGTPVRPAAPPWRSRSRCRALLPVVAGASDGLPVTPLRGSWFVTRGADDVLMRSGDEAQ